MSNYVSLKDYFTYSQKPSASRRSPT